jgi:hypothetical protein
MPKKQKVDRKNSRAPHSESGRSNTGTRRLKKNKASAWIIRDILAEPMTVIKGGVRAKMTGFEVALRRHFITAVQKHDLKAAVTPEEMRRLQAKAHPVSTNSDSGQPHKPRRRVKNGK